MEPLSLEADVARSLVRFHKAITRGLTVGVTRGQEYLQGGFQDQQLQQGYATYLSACVAVLTSHHVSEDGAAFPVLKEKLPQAPIQQLAADHRFMEKILQRISSHLPGMTAENPVRSLEGVVKGLQGVIEIWSPHIAVEERVFNAAAIAGAMSAAEQAALINGMARMSQELGLPAPLMAPFLVFNLEGADRAELVSLMPAVVVKQLIPVDWKEQWAPMKPFLLD